MTSKINGLPQLVYANACTTSDILQLKSPTVVNKHQIKEAETYPYNEWMYKRMDMRLIHLGPKKKERIEKRFLKLPCWKINKRK